MSEVPVFWQPLYRLRTMKQLIYLLPPPLHKTAALTVASDVEIEHCLGSLQWGFLWMGFRPT